MQSCCRRISSYNVAAAALAATDPVPWCWGHKLLEISVSGSVPVFCLLYPRPPGCTQFEHEAVCQQCVRETDWCPQKDWKWEQGPLDHEQLLFEFTTAWERNQEQIEDGIFFTKTISRQMGHFFYSSAVHTLTCAFPQTHRVSCVVQWNASASEPGVQINLFWRQNYNYIRNKTEERKKNRLLL